MAFEYPSVNEPISDKEGFVSKIWFRWANSVSNAINTLMQNTVNLTPANSPYTVTTNTFRLVCNTTTGDIVVNFPIGFPECSARVVNSGTGGNDVTMNGNGTELIDGSASKILVDGEKYNGIYTSISGWR